MSALIATRKNITDDKRRTEGKRMKMRRCRLVALILALALVLPMISDAKIEAKSGYYFKNAGVKVTMGSAAKKFIKKSGKPISVKKKKSCAFKGYDRIRKYSSFILYTYTNTKTGPEYVNGVTFLTASAKTAEGIGIGSTSKQVKKAYGKASNGLNTFSKGKTKLMIIIGNGKVSAVRYVMKK